MPKQLPLIIAVASLSLAKASWAQDITNLSHVKDQLTQLSSKFSQRGGQVAVFVSSQTAGMHVVESGESLWSISRKYRVDYEQLKAVNGLKGDEPVIRIGDSLRIPGRGQVAPAASPVSQGALQHRVANSETLYRIARRYGVSVSAIQQANGIQDPRTIKVDDLLVIPGVGAAVRTPASRAAVPGRRIQPTTPAVKPPAGRGGTASPGFGTYVVQPGDSLASIAKAYRSSVEELVRVNRFSSPRYQVKPGDYVQVPSNGSWYLAGGRAAAPQARSAVAFTKYRVGSGETMEVIAKRFGITVQQLKVDNPRLTTNKAMQAGMELRVRAAKS